MGHVVSTNQLYYLYRSPYPLRFESALKSGQPIVADFFC